MSILKTEWLKIKKYPAFWWMLSILSLSYPGMNYAIYANGYKDQLNDPKMGFILKMLPNPFSFPDVWQTVAFISSLFVFLPAIVVIMFITNEYSFKTHRQNVIDGWSRTDFMLSKLTDVLIISVLITLLYTITAVVIGVLNAGGLNGVSWTGTRYIVLFFLQQFSQLSIAFLIALLVRRAFIALGIFLFYFFPLEPMLVQLGKKYTDDLGRFLPLETSDRLIPGLRWFIKDDAEWARLLTQSNTHVLYALAMTSLIWGICFWINQKRDL